MSGLAAVFHRDERPIDEAAVWSMLVAVPYRGPDGMSVTSFGPLAIGHAKMAVTMEDQLERQPLVSTRSGCAIVADVRLDNREELLARLPIRLAPTTGDAELILCAYEAWGFDALARLLGDFAFVIWDPRQQRVICARDTSGQRELFYRADHQTFAVASEIHQLFQDPGVPVAPNEECIRDSLVPLNMFCNDKDQAATFYQGVVAVPAGHVVAVDRDTLREWHYWELKPPPELRYRSDDEYAEHYRALFFDVVQARLRSSHPVGALLSGGLDSSSVVCTAQELYRLGRATDLGFTSLSSVFDGLDCDESHLIRDMQMKYGFVARLLSCGEYAGRLQLEPRGFMEVPNMGITEVRDAMFRTATDAGVRTLLTGDVADACVGGSRLVFDSLLRHGRLRAFWQQFSLHRKLSDESLPRSVAFNVLIPLLPPARQKWIMSAYTRRVVGRYRGRLLPPWMPGPLREELAERHLRLWLALERGRRFSSPSREAEFRMLYPPEVARHPVPWSLEIWRPFADRRLHEFLLAVPPEQKFVPHSETDDFYAGSKRLVRRAMRGIIPDSIRTRTDKVHFGTASLNEVQRQWPLYEAAFGPSARPEVVRRGYVDQEKFWGRLQEMRAGVDSADVVYVTHIVALETWLRTFSLPRSKLTTVPPPWDTRDASQHTELSVSRAV